MHIYSSGTKSMSTVLIEFMGYLYMPYFDIVMSVTKILNLLACIQSVLNHQKNLCCTGTRHQLWRATGCVTDASSSPAPGTTPPCCGTATPGKPYTL